MAAITKEVIPKWIQDECQKKTGLEPECGKCWNSYECRHDLARVYPAKGESHIR